MRCGNSDKIKAPSNGQSRLIGTTAEQVSIKGHVGSLPYRIGKADSYCAVVGENESEILKLVKTLPKEAEK